MNCDCLNFRKKLVNLCYEVLDKGDGRLQWKMFEQFLMNYVQDDTHDIRVFIDETPFSETYFTTFCSLKISSLLVHKLDDFRRRDVALSTLLVDLITILHLNFCSRFHESLIWNFEESFLNNRGTLMLLGALQCSYDFQKLLLNFGFLRRLSGDSPRLIRELECKFNYFIFSINNYTFISAEDHCYKTGKAMELVKRVCFPYKETECCKRMFLSLMAIHAIQMYLLKKDYSIIEKCLSCFDLYFTGTQDALLSVYEVKSTLYVCFKLMNKFYLFDIYCQEFDKFMPGCPAKMEPRRLTHLTRCQIRQNLKLNKLSMPSAVDKLLLPKNLKRFLLCEVLDIARKKGNASSEKSMFQSKLLLSDQSAFPNKQQCTMKNNKRRRLNDND